MVQLLFCFPYSFTGAQTTAFTRLKKFCTSQLSSVFHLSRDLSWCMVSFLKRDLQFSKLFKNTICISVCTLKYTKKNVSSLLPPSIFSLNLSPIQNLMEALNVPPWNVLYHTSLRNYTSISLQVPSNLSILLGYIFL
jgi:hypothetical protein